MRHIMSAKLDYKSTDKRTDEFSDPKKRKQFDKLHNFI